MISEDLKARFKALGNFPSPPGIAQEIIMLAKNPEASIATVTSTIAKDPALAAKLLRIANSPLYAQRRRSPNLRQALLVVGLDAAMTLCLSFSLAASLRAGKASSIDYALYWRRSLIAALGGRCLGEEIGLEGAEDLFLAALLQDIGILALDRAKPGFYKELSRTATHQESIAYEKAHLDGTDHAALGAWLLGSWNLPDILSQAVLYSHTPETTEATTDAGRFARCVALGSDLALALLAADRAAAIQTFKQRAELILGMRSDAVLRVLDRVTQLTPDLGQLFDTKVFSPEDVVLIMEEAQELLAERSVESLHEISALQKAASSLAERSVELEDANRRDALTGVHNRRFLDEKLAQEFSAASEGHWPLGLLFVDLDHFKRINDTYGHQAGDIVLRESAVLLRKALRNADLLARYGGEEFVILLPAVTPLDSRRVAERILTGLRNHKHALDDAQVTVTASLGFAVHTPEKPFPDASSLLAAADAAVYAAKRAGRNQLAVAADPAERRVANGG